MRHAASVKKYAFALVLSLIISGQAAAYETAVKTRSASEKSFDDDVVVIEITGLSRGNPDWFVSDNQESQIVMIPNSVQLRRRLPREPGYSKIDHVNFNSLEVIHDLSFLNGSETYNMKLYIGADMIWIELQNSTVKSAPVRNAVFFSGFDSTTYREMLLSPKPIYRYTKSDELKKDVAENYAEIFDPRNIGLIQYNTLGRATLSQMNLFTAD